MNNIELQYSKVQTKLALVEGRACDHDDYMIAVFAGVVSGIIDSLFVNKPNFKGIANSALNSLTDKESEKILSFLADKHSDCDIKWKSIKEKVS